MADIINQHMRWANALSTQPSLETAVDEVVAQVTQQLQAPADLALVFISAAFASEYSRLMPLLKSKLPVPFLVGCSGGGRWALRGEVGFGKWKMLLP